MNIFELIRQEMNIKAKAALIYCDIRKIVHSEIDETEKKKLIDQKVKQLKELENEVSSNNRNTQRSKDAI